MLDERQGRGCRAGRARGRTGPAARGVGEAACGSERVPVAQLRAGLRGSDGTHGRRLARGGGMMEFFLILITLELGVVCVALGTIISGLQDIEECLRDKSDVGEGG